MLAAHELRARAARALSRGERVARAGRGPAWLSVGVDSDDPLAALVRPRREVPVGRDSPRCAESPRARPRPASYRAARVILYTPRLCPAAWARESSAMLCGQGPTITLPCCLRGALKHIFRFGGFAKAANTESHMHIPIPLISIALRTSQ